MSAPMAGFGPMAYSPFPYGAPASSGIPSDMFVDLFNDQTAAGKKSWIVTASGTETVAEWGVSDSTGRFEILNVSSSANSWGTVLRGTSSGANVGLFIIGAPTTDSGTTTPAFVFDGRTAAAAALTVKDIAAIRNFGTTYWKIGCTGLITEGGGKVVRVRVALTTPVTVSATTDYVVVSNLSAAGAVAINLPAGVAGQEYVVKDGKGDANVNNITITPAAGTIDGAATLVINTAYGRARLVYNGTEWNRID